jgi:hypothetical protein
VIITAKNVIGSHAIQALKNLDLAGAGTWLLMAEGEFGAGGKGSGRRGGGGHGAVAVKAIKAAIQ